MKTEREKKLEIALLKEKLERISNKKVLFKEKEEEYICWDAGEGNYEIEKYNPKVSWHNDSDVFIGTYHECLKHKKESEEDAYRFRHNMSHKSWGYDA